MKEAYLVKWDPLEGLMGKFCLDLLQYENNCLELVMYSVAVPRNRIKLTFPPGTVYFYSQSDEVACLRFITSVRLTCGEEMYKSTFFETINSHIIQEIQKEGYLQNMPEKLYHFGLIEVMSAVDIIASCEPVAEWLERVDQQEAEMPKIQKECVNDKSIGELRIAELKDGRMAIATAESASGWPSLIIRENYDEKGFLFTKTRYVKK